MFALYIQAVHPSCLNLASNFYTSGRRRSAVEVTPSLLRILPRPRPGLLRQNYVDSNSVVSTITNTDAAKTSGVYSPSVDWR